MSYELGLDRSGNGNNLTVTNLTLAADQVLDSPTNNFAVLNAVWKDSSVNLQEGNLRHNRTSNMNRPGLSTLGMGTGKWYFEAWDSYTTGNQIGIQWEDTDVETYVHDSGTQAYTWNNPGSTYENGVYAGGSGAGSVASGANIRMVAYDGATGKLWGGANGTWGSSGDPAAGTNESMTVPVAYRDKMHGIVATENSSTAQGIIANFGQDSSFAGNKTAQGNQDDNEIGDFYYDVPAGFMALCTSNMSDATVTPSANFNTVLWAGSGGSQTITSVGFQPDLVWVKGRNTTDGHHWFDAVRGFGSAKSLSSNSTQGEGAYDALYGYISSPSSTGFTASAGSAGSQYVDHSSYNYVAWNWKAGGGAGSSNTNGSINTTSTSANTDAGFSISTYTGTGSNATIGHGLSKAPEMIITKRRDATYDPSWLVYHDRNTAAPETDYLKLNVNGATTDDATVWNDTAPTATVFSVGTHASVNNNTSTYVAYCFHSVDGFSHIGSYLATQNADGPFNYTGFKPAFIIIKKTSGTEWILTDNTRTGNEYNYVDNTIRPDGAFAEAGASTYNRIDFLSNGFKIRDGGSGINWGTGITHTYIAFAETPFKYSNAR